MIIFYMCFKKKKKYVKVNCVFLVLLFLAHTYNRYFFNKRIYMFAPSPLPTASRNSNGLTFMVVCRREYQTPLHVPQTTPLSDWPEYFPFR